MKKNIFIKFLCRSPLKAIFIFLLIALMSFGFIGRSVQYIAVSSEIEKLSDFYKPIGTLIPDNENLIYLTDDAKQTLLEDTSIDFINLQRSFCGMSKTMITPATDPRSPTNMVYFYGTVDDIDLNESENKYFSNLLEEERCRYDCAFYVSPDKLEAGYPENIPLNEQIVIHWYGNDKDTLDKLLSGIKDGERYFFKTRILFYDSYYQGKRFSQYLLEPIEDNIYFYRADNGADVNISSKSVLNDMTLRNLQRNALTLITTKDMTLSPYIQDNFFLTDGRYLTKEDNSSKNKVCVIREEMAEAKGLSVGDTVTLNVRNSDPPKDYIKEGKNWDEVDTFQETFEIVGTYGAVEIDYTNYYHDIIYIPDSVIPEQWGSDRKNMVDGSYFVLNSPESAEAFSENCGTVLANEGYSVTFLENGWESFQKASVPIKQTSLADAAVFAVILCAAITVAVFFFLITYRKEWLILRLLGVPKSNTFVQLGVSSVVVSTSAIVLGGILSWNYSLNKAGQLLSPLEQQSSGRVTVSLPLYWLLLLCLAVFILWLAIFTAGLALFGRKNLMNYFHLQKNTNTSRKKTSSQIKTSQHKFSASINAAPKPTFKVNFIPDTINTTQIQNGRPPLTFTVKYIVKHLTRTPGKNTLTIIIVFCFILGLGFMQGNIQSNEKKMDMLYNNTTITGKIVPKDSSITVLNDAYIYQDVVSWLSDSGFVNNFILEAAVTSTASDVSERNYVNQTTVAFEKPESYEPIASGEMTITYADGYDASVFSIPEDTAQTEKNFVILPETVAKEIGLKPGDKMRMKAAQDVNGLWRVSSKDFKLIGTHNLENGPFLMPLTSLKSLMGTQNIYYTRVEFDFKHEKNRQINDFKEELANVLELEDNQYMVKTACLIRDEELTQAIDPLQKNVNFMKVLYPIVIAISVLVTSVICILIILMSDKEAAIMRVLGTAKPRIAMTLASEQIFLCLFALIISIFLSIFIFRDYSELIVYEAIKCSVFCIAGAIVSSIVCSIILAKRRPLSLLQVKE